MAKVELNSALSGLRGTMDNWVYRRTRRGGTTVGRRPIFSGAPTAAQQAVRERFRSAAAYAKSALLDPALRGRYELAARSRQMQAYAFALTDFMMPPVVDAIDPSGYHGRLGDVIKVSAFDDFEVTGVTVAVRDGEGAILMQGAAVLTDGRWNYAATAAVAVGEAVTIEAVATDRPGQTGSRTLPLVIA
jgi:hypothetical protein